MLLLFLLVDGFVLVKTFALTTYDPFVIIFTVSLIILAIWTGVFFCKLKELIEKQARDLQDLKSAERYRDNRLAKIEKQKTAARTAMAKYKEELQSILVDKYEEFEKVMMKSVQDSKLIATILKKSGYADLLHNYRVDVRGYIDNIKKLEAEAADVERSWKDTKVQCHNKLINRQSQGIFGYHRFFPRNLIYKEIELP